MRCQPNILITGTPGVGKTSHCEMLAKNTGLRHVSVNDIVKDNNFHEGYYSAEDKTYVIDEDKLLDYLEDVLQPGGCIVDYHSCELFPKRWFDLVVVIRVNSTTLYDRLAARNYPEAKLQENLDVEIMEVILQEARDSYDEEIVIELMSDTTEDLENNVDRMETWIQRWVENNHNTESGQSPDSGTNN